jgi:very-long-chain enoyl-CoA reductase
MFLLYAPSALLGVHLLGSHGTMFSRADICAILMILHFVKRCLECLFLHKYSGTMPLATSMTIAPSYSVFCWIICAYTQTVPDTFFSEYTLPLGISLFVTGTAGNFYHHYLLATLRKPGEKGYKVPKGGFFEYVAAPHYLFELIAWLGVSLVSQHFLSFLCFLGMTAYLIDRSIAQAEWNRKKMESYPKERKNMLPFVF